MRSPEPVPEKYYIQATAARGADDRTRVLKQGESFGVFDRSGTIPEGGKGELGIFHEGTRFLSRFELLLDGQPPLLLASAADRHNELVTNLTNPDLHAGGRITLQKDTVHLLGTGLLWQAAYRLRLRVRNYAMTAVDLGLRLLFAADYADVFEVRGMPRERRGRMLETVVGKASVLLGYHGLDDRVRRTRITFSPAPAELSGGAALLRRSLAAREEQTIEVTVACESGAMSPGRPAVLTFADAARSAARLRRRSAAQVAIKSSNEQLNDWTHRSGADIQMMITDTDHGPYPYAGIPWFSTVFGRDGIITALATLWMFPELARGVLAFLAHHQAVERDAERDAEPGKILHEMRAGEMAALGEVPFGCYYGSVDSTPLFVMLAGEYWARTADREQAAAIWPHVERALAWIDRDGDADGDGFVEYSRRSSQGLASQGWKDSGDSISHQDGSLAEGPVALCEVQAYVYAARRRAAELAAALGKRQRAGELLRQAEELRRRFEEAFWLEGLGTYALALDGDKRPCAVRASNAGHCLYGGIAAAERAASVAATLTAAGSYSGWGIRTLDEAEARYNPMSYHNGSVWPHDNALIAAGLARYGLREAAAKVFGGLFAASVFIDLHRMPELFCGFPRRPHEGPTLYPVACSPQSWAAAAVFLLLQSTLGLVIDAPNRRLCLDRPDLPRIIQKLEIRNLQVAGASLDLTFRRHLRDIGVTVERKAGDLEVVVVK
jgi:glycogen debranching enzyme